MGKLGKRARKFAKKNLQSVMKKKRKLKSMLNRRMASAIQRSNLEKSDKVSSEQEFEGKFVGIPIGAADFSSSLDGTYSQDDVNLIEDGFDEDSILSEVSECPYISDVELESNDKENSEHASLSESNLSIFMEIESKKTKVGRLLAKAPNFSKFLESRRAELENLKNEGTDSDEEGAINDPNNASATEKHSIDRRAINSCTIDLWCWLVMEQPKGPGLSNLLNVFRAACCYGLDSAESQLLEFPNKKVFSNVLMFVLCEADDIFRKMLGVSDSCSKVSLSRSMNSSEWKVVRPLVKSYLKSCLLLLNQVTDGQILVFILSRIKSSIIFFDAFPSLIELLIKIIVHLWVTGEESISLSSFMVAREIALKLNSKWYDTCLMRTYKAFIGQSIFFESGNLKHVQFLENSIVELYSIDLQISYHHVFASLQQLANILSQSIKTKKKEELKKIHNWRYINCIHLWVKFIDCSYKNHDLRPLLSLSILIINGIAHLFPGLRYLPLRVKCVQMLNQLSLSSGIFIPVTYLIIDFLDNKGCITDATRVKSFNFSSMLKVPKHLLKSFNFHEECILSAIELLSVHFSQWKYHISFAELATLPLMLFKRLHENLSNETLRRQVKHFIDQVEQNRDFIERKRDEISFSPKDHTAIDSFLQMEKCDSNCSFNQYYAGVQEKFRSRTNLK